MKSKSQLIQEAEKYFEKWGLPKDEPVWADEEYAIERETILFAVDFHIQQIGKEKPDTGRSATIKLLEIIEELQDEKQQWEKEREELKAILDNYENPPPSIRGVDRI